MTKSNSISIPMEIIQNKIFFIRGQKVMFDQDLAKLYGVETRALNQAVKRNQKRFPEDFMFQLNNNELKIWESRITISNNEKNKRNLKSQIVISNWGGRRKIPYVFTEQGVAMLSSVLKSERAIEVNIQIMRTFTHLRKMMATHEELRRKIEQMEKKYDKNFQKISEPLICTDYA